MAQHEERIRSALKDWMGAPRDPEVRDFEQFEEQDRAAVTRAATEVRAAWTRGDLVATHAAIDEWVGTLAGSVRFSEDGPSPRELAARAAGDPVPSDERDEMDPRKLAEHIRTF